MRRLLLLLIVGTALFAPKGPSALAAGDHPFAPDPETGEVNIGLRDVIRDEFAPGLKVRHSDRRIEAPSGVAEIASRPASIGGSAGWVLVLSSESILGAVTPSQKTRAPPHLQVA